jgi:hypothetical protein
MIMFGIADGYVTYAAAGVSVLVGLYLVAQGQETTGLGFITTGLIGLGIRNSIEAATTA